MTIPDTPAGDALLSLIWTLYTKKLDEQRANALVPEDTHYHVAQPQSIPGAR
jgi:hypothetical protein